MVAENVVVFVVSLFIGGLGIYAGARLFTGSRNYGHAVITAAIGAVVWVVVGALFGDIPFLGPLVTLLAYLAVIKWRYAVGWLTAAGIALVAWIAALATLYVLAVAGATEFRAVGVPGV